MSADNQRGLAAILGTRFSTIPQFSKAWEKAVKDEDADAVAGLTPNATTNKGNRQKYFSNTRRRFWGYVYDDKGKDGALELITSAGANIPKRGNAARMMINGRNQTFDVDHLVGLAEDPTKMLSADNLQLSPAQENRRVLEDIARVDIFYDPQKWLKEQAEKAKKAEEEMKKTGNCPIESAPSE